MELGTSMKQTSPAHNHRQQEHVVGVLPSSASSGHLQHSKSNDNLHHHHHQQTATSDFLVGLNERRSSNNQSPPPQHRQCNRNNNQQQQQQQQSQQHQAPQYGSSLPGTVDYSSRGSSHAKDIETTTSSRAPHTLPALIQHHHHQSLPVSIMDGGPARRTVEDMDDDCENDQPRNNAHNKRDRVTTDSSAMTLGSLVGVVGSGLPATTLGLQNICQVPPVAADHKHLIDKLRSDGYISSDRVYKAMLSVNFSNFGWSYSYSDALYIAIELENCANHIKEGQHVLVIYSCYYLYIPLCIALMVGPKGQVVAHGDEGTEFVRKDHSHILDSKRLVLVNFNWDTFKTEGFPMKAPYDVILVCEKYFSDEVKEQLRCPGGLAYDQVINKVIHEAEEVLVSPFDEPSSFPPAVVKALVVGDLN